MLTGVFGIFQNETPVVRNEDRRFPFDLPIIQFYHLFFDTFPKF